MVDAEEREMPWCAAEVPTVFVSLNVPTPLVDVPMVKTAINAHTPTAESVRARLAKLTGRSEFRGTITRTSGATPGTRDEEPLSERPRRRTLSP